MLSVLGQRNYALLWLGGLISLTGDWMLIVALPIYVYRTTGSTLATSTMLMAGMAPRLLLGSVAGVFVDRWDRKRTLVITNVVLTAVVLSLVAVQATGWLGLVYLVAFARSAFAQFLMPAQNALLPRLVGEEQVAQANSATALNNNLSRLVGPPAGGIVAGVAGLTGVALCDAASYLIAALLIAMISLTPTRGHESSTHTSPTSARPWSRAWSEWLAGLRLVRGERLLSIMFLLTAITALGEGVMSVLFVIFVSTVLHGGAREFGWLVGIQAVGGLLGGVLIGLVAGRVPSFRLLGLGAVLLGLIDLAIFNYPAFMPGLAPAITLMAIVGIPAVGYVTGVTTILQTAAPDRYRGRIFGAYATTSALLSLVGAALAGVSAARLGVVPVLNVDGGAYVVAGLMALLLLRGATAGLSPGGKTTDARREEPTIA